MFFQKLTVILSFYFKPLIIIFIKNMCIKKHLSLIGTKRVIIALFYAICENFSRLLIA